MTTRQLLAAPTAMLALTLALGSRAAAQQLPGPRAAPQWVTAQPELPPSHAPWAAATANPLTRDLLAQRGRRRAPGTVLMIVGGAVAGAGILTDESLLIVGGVVVAGYGLYIYLR